MKLTHDDHIGRLHAMLLDDGGTWGLSDNDKAAIRHILGLKNFLVDELAAYTGYPFPKVEQIAADKVIGIQQKGGAE